MLVLVTGAVILFFYLLRRVIARGARTRVFALLRLPFMRHRDTVCRVSACYIFTVSKADRSGNNSASVQPS